MEGYPEVTGGAAAEWREHIRTHQAPGVEWNPLTGYSPEQLLANATATYTTGEGAEPETVEPKDHKPGEREFGGDSRVLTPVQIVNLGKPVVHSVQEQPAGDDSITYQVPGKIIDKL